MAVLTAFLVLFLYLNSSSGYTLMRDDDIDIVWPTEYHFKGEKLDFMSTLKEPFEIWYSTEHNRSRIDYNGGAVKTVYYGDDGYAFSINPVTTEEVTNALDCSLSEFIDEQKDFLPDVSNLTFTGQTMTIYDRVVDIWKETVEYERKMVRETILYVIKTDSGIDLPVQRIVKKYNYNIGEVSTHVVINYFDFTDKVSKEDVSVDEECRDYGLGKDFTFYHTHDKAFESFTKHHSKDYRENEHMKRKTIFEKNRRMVEEHNRKNTGYRMELNRFSDWTKEELKFLTGTSLSTNNYPEMMAFPHSLEEIDELAKDLPDHFDLRMEGSITPVKNQDSCGSCWAFATTAAVEGALAMINRDRLLDLSEQSLVDCAWGYSNGGCDGGTLDGALKYVLLHGIPTESDYGTYTANDDYCYIQNMTSTYKIRGFALVTPRSPNALKVALTKYGPVTVAIHSSDSMVHYSNGLFYDFSCENSHPNHAVTVVGYGVRDDEDYWIVKNSWGNDWGEDGYILMSAKNNNCFLLDTPYYAIV